MLRRGCSRLPNFSTVVVLINNSTACKLKDFAKLCDQLMYLELQLCWWRSRFCIPFVDMHSVAPTNCRVVFFCGLLVLATVPPTPIQYCFGVLQTLGSLGQFLLLHGSILLSVLSARQLNAYFTVWINNLCIVSLRWWLLQRSTGFVDAFWLHHIHNSRKDSNLECAADLRVKFTLPRCSCTHACG